ncbi:MAG: TonB-dependent receptor [Candidatus Latescibacteria bacterium]|jgi:iron complex outermembrane recepter protein|nr:TonB-dependent receptor [Candidatus Latescibacterota bacterium]
MKKHTLIQSLPMSVVCGVIILQLFHALTAYADESETQIYKIDPVTVIATRTPKETLDTPASTSVITEDEIRAFNSEHPFKPLEKTEGIWPRQYRGLADYWARSLIRGHRALVLVDGVNWYDYGYYYHTGAIPMPDVERIEVVRGPFSALYGSLAQTGVINYITKIPDDREIDASASYGDWGSRYYSFRIADRPFAENGSDITFPWMKDKIGDRFFYSLSFKSRTSDGYVTTPSYKSFSSATEGALDPDIPVTTGWEKDIDPQSGKDRYKIGHQGNNWYDDYGLFFKTGYDVSPDTQLWYSLNVSKFDYGWRDGKSFLKNSVNQTLYDNNVYIQDAGSTYLTSLSPSLFTANPVEKKSITNTLHFNHSKTDLVDIEGLFSYNDKKSGNHYISSSRYKVEDNYLAQVDLSATFHLLDNNALLTTGFQGIQEGATVTDENLSDPYDTSSTLFMREKTAGKNRTFGTFIQAEYSPLYYLTLYAGGRYDHWWGTDANYYSNLSGEYSTDHPDTDDGKFSPKISAVFRPKENGTIRASYGEAFTAPSLYYRTASYYWESGGTRSIASPNPNLRPTTNKSWEIGTEWEFLRKRIRFKSTYFNNDFKDLIVNQETTSTLSDGTQLIEKKRVNAEEAVVQGIETSIETVLPYNIKSGLFYAHNWSEYTKTQALSKLGWEVEETPTDIFSYWLGYFGRRLDASASYKYSDSRYDDDYCSYGNTSYRGDDPYHVLDAKVTFRLMEHVALSLSVDNIFDSEYYEYYRAPGRFLLSTMSVSY